MNNAQTITPLNILEIDTLHQIPSNPREVEAKKYANGIRAAVNTILIIEGGTVFPSPANAPAVVISTHINNCE